LRGACPCPTPSSATACSPTASPGPVRLDAAGKQYVVGPDGQRVPGVWVLPPEVPPDAPPATATES